MVKLLLDHKAQLAVYREDVILAEALIHATEQHKEIFRLLVVPIGGMRRMPKTPASFFKAITEKNCDYPRQAHALLNMIESAAMYDCSVWIPDEKTVLEQNDDELPDTTNAFLLDR